MLVAGAMVSATLNVTVLVTAPSVAVITPVPVPVVVIGKLTRSLSAGTVTVCGTGAAGLLLVSATDVPPKEPRKSSTTVPVATPLGCTDGGSIDRAERLGCRTNEPTWR